MAIKQNLNIPLLPEGKQYRLLLRLPGFSVTKDILKGGVIGGSIPMISISNKCICCNKETTNKKTINPFHDNRELPEPFEVPVCKDCSKHSLADQGLSMLFGIIAFIGIILTTFMIIKIYMSTINSYIGWDFFFLSCGIIITAIGCFLVYKNGAKKKLQISGHCPGTKFHSQFDKELTIETSNKRVVEEILSNNKSVVWHINTTADPVPFKITSNA